MVDDYGAAVERQRQAVAEARLNDPGEHFPYKTHDAKAAIKKPMAPDADIEGPDVTGADVMSVRIAEASEAYIQAQADHLANPSRATKSAYDAATDDLIAARRAHRRNRVDQDGKPTGGMIATSSAPPPPGQFSWRAKRIGEA